LAGKAGGDARKRVALALLHGQHICLKNTHRWASASGFARMGRRPVVLLAPIGHFMSFFSDDKRDRIRVFEISGQVSEALSTVRRAGCLPPDGGVCGGGGPQLTTASSRLTAAIT
jgi:hypothetical protein